MAVVHITEVPMRRVLERRSERWTERFKKVFGWNVELNGVLNFDGTKVRTDVPLWFENL